MNMKTVNLNKTWNYLAAAIHRVKPRRDNLLKREALFGLQILLNQYELAKNEKNSGMMKLYIDILRVYERHNLVGKLSNSSI